MSLNPIADLFAKSPIEPLEKHIKKSHECCSLLIPFFEAWRDGDWAKVEKLRHEISMMEKDADTLKREIRLNLPKGLFMPVNRADLLDLVTQQDRIANKAKDIAGMITGRQMHLPKAIQADLMAFLKRSVDATNQTRKAINELEELLEAGFRGRERQVMNKLINELDRIEDDTDSMQINLRRQMFLLETELQPLDALHLYKVIERVGDLADLAERVGARLEIMVAHA